jgi:probable O-glycosylation ligase (exosortase A-associated)
MRVALLHLASLGFCAAGLVNPIVALLGYLWYSLMRPDALAWVEGAYPYSLILAVVALLGSWRFAPNAGGWLRSPFVWSLVLLQVPILLSIVYSPRPDLSWPAYFRYFKILVVCLLIPLFIQTERHFRWLMFTMVVSLGVLGFKYGLFGLRSGGVHIVTGLGGFMSDNNTLAMALVMAFPMIWYSRSLVAEQWKKQALLVVAFTTVVAIIMVHSRAAILTLGVVYLMMAWRSRHKVAMLVVAAMMSLPAIYLVRDSFVQRMRTLEDPESEGSAKQRMGYARAAVKMWKDYPLLGVGFGTENWARLSPEYLVNQKAVAGHVVHNNYLQMAVDSGAGAFAILVAQLFGAIWWLGYSAKRMRKVAPGKEAYPRALQLALIAFAVCSLFASRTDYDFYYYLIMATAAWRTVERDEILPALAVAPVPIPQVAEPVPDPEIPPVSVGPAPYATPVAPRRPVWAMRMQRQSLHR